MPDRVHVKVGPGLPIILFLLFLTLKLTGYISWSWWWVTAPLWTPLALILLLVTGFVIFAFAAGRR